jgi:hypothetical protein
MRQEFEVHVLNEAGLDKAKAIADIFSVALNAIEMLVPPGRERAVVTTKLQEAAFFAKRGMANVTSNQQERA